MCVLGGGAVTPGITLSDEQWPAEAVTEIVTAAGDTACPNLDVLYHEPSFMLSSNSSLDKAPNALFPPLLPRSMGGTGQLCVWEELTH